jgi:hypothetical protein
MRLVRLRHQMLIAMGIPACWTGPSVPPPTVQQPPPPKVATGFDAHACPRDTVVETVCGSRRENARTCGPKGSMLGAVEESKLYISPDSDEEPAVAYREFSFDREATKKYREDLTDPSTAESCCYSQCATLVVGVADPVQLQAGFSLEERCMPAPPNGTSRPAKGDPACAAGIAFDGVLRPYVSTVDGECCYSVPTEQVKIHAIPGRALRVDGVPQVAAIAHGDGWRADLQPDLDLAADVRARLARAWLETAQLEHASIAAFASLALRLVAAGAPAELIAAAHAAALDEVKHARIAFELASAYAGRRLAPGRFDVATRAAATCSIAALAIETFVDGCINETAAAHQAEVAAEHAADPVVAAALREIAGDEARHAALAWAIVAWCVREGGVTLDELRSRMPEEATPASEDEDLSAHGILGDAAAAVVRENVVRDVVGPCLDALAA